MWTKSKIAIKAKPNILELSLSYDILSYDTEDWIAFCNRVAGKEFTACIMTMFYVCHSTGENVAAVEIFCDNDRYAIQPAWLESFNHELS